MNYQRFLRSSLKLALGLFFLFLLIELLAWKFSLPHFSEIFRAGTAQFEQGHLKHDAEVTTARWLIGWAIGAVCGISLGLLTGRLFLISFFVEDFMVLLRGIPFISLIPILLIIFGLSETGKFFLVGYAASTIIWITVHHAAKNIPNEIVWRSQSLGLTRMNWIFKVLIPSCSKQIYSGLRTTLSLGFIVVAVAESSGVYELNAHTWWSEGLGYRILRAQDQSSDADLMAVILVFSFVSICSDLLFRTLWDGIAELKLRVKAKATKRRLARIGRTAAGQYNNKPGELKITSLTASYGQTTVLKDFDLTLPAGKVLCIVGYSGCGKSTLLKSIGHFYDAELKIRGNISLAGEEQKNAGHHIGVVFQDSSVFGHLNVWENVALGNRIKTEQDKAYALSILKEFDMEEQTEQLASTLSGGQRQRLALASALANRSSMLLLDEPFASLDAITKQNLHNFFINRIKDQVTSVFVTHDIDEAIALADYILVGVKSDSPLITVDRTSIVREFDVYEKKRGYKEQIMAYLQG